MIKSFFRAIYLVYFVLVFWFLILLFVPFYVLASWFFGEKSTPYLIWCSHYVVARLTYLFTFIRLKVKGKEHVDKQQTYVIVSNHQSQLDIFANALATPIIFKFLGKKEVKKLPIFGYVVSLLVITIDRKSRESKEQGFKDMVAALEEGYSILLYPEGSRNRTKEPLTTFYDGAFRLAISTNTPILVETIVGTRSLMSPPLGLGLQPGKVTCYIDPPINTKNMTLDDIDDLKLRVKEIMQGHLLS